MNTSKTGIPQSNTNLKYMIYSNHIYGKNGGNFKSQQSLWETIYFKNTK